MSAVPLPGFVSCLRAVTGCLFEDKQQLYPGWAQPSLAERSRRLPEPGADLQPEN